MKPFKLTKILQFKSVLPSLNFKLFFKIFLKSNISSRNYHKNIFLLKHDFNSHFDGTILLPQVMLLLCFLYNFNLAKHLFHLWSFLHVSPSSLPSPICRLICHCFLTALVIATFLFHSARNQSSYSEHHHGENPVFVFPHSSSPKFRYHHCQRRCNLHYTSPLVA